MAGYLGNIAEFRPDSEPISAYLERMDIFLAANGISEDKRVAVFLSLVGGTTYGLLRNLCSPTKPQDKSYKDLKGLLTKHFDPEPLVIAERFHFHRREQGAEESISVYVAELRRLASTCQFKEAFLPEALRDRFVCGLRSEAIQRNLLSQEKLDLKKAVDTALAMEAAEKNAKALKSGTDVTMPIQKLSRGRQSRNSPGNGGTVCYRCGRGEHNPAECRFKSATCHRCGKVGHIAPVCRSVPSRKNDTSKNKHRGASRQNQVGEASDSDDSEDQLAVKQIFVVGSKSASAPITMQLTLNEHPFSMELDTGAAVSIISQSQQEKELPDIKLTPCSIRLKTYTGERMHVVGEAAVEVCCNQQKETLPLIVVTGDGPALFGRNWLRKIRLDWKSIGSIRAGPQRSLQELLSKHTEVFSEELGKMKSVEVKLHVRPDAQPKFFKPRPVPLAIRPAIDEELDRLEAEGILKKVPTSDWAAPIVTVPKKDGKFRICGDFKVTVNPALDIEHYPLPKPQDLFASLAGGQKFTKLDLNQAYLQIPLEEESQKYVTVNTHRGLYRYTRLPFGISTAPAVFQKAMDTMLQGLSGVVCYLDDILVTGEDDESHLKNLQCVLERLQSEGLRLKKKKCSFLQSSVEYLGHCVDAEGRHPTKDKLRAVLDAPVPKNIKELRSFLGLLNYYSSFIPNLSSLLHPLNRLLSKDSKWNWSPECDSAFQAAKESLTSSSVLVHYNPDLPLRVAADASSHGLGAVLSHVMPDLSERPVAYASRSLSTTEKKYAQVEKEALALIYAVKKFHQYLYGRIFTLITDHKPLLVILGPKKGIPSLAAARLQRWAVLLSAYSYQIEYKSSEKHGNADALSRLPLPNRPSKALDAAACFNIGQIHALPDTVTADMIRSITRTDPILSKVLLFTKSGWPTEVAEDLKPFYRHRSELTIQGGCLLRGSRVVIPQRLRESMLQELHRGHPGMVRMKSVARSYVWWPGVDKDVELLARSCRPCQMVKQAQPTVPLHPWAWPAQPWQRIHIDFAGPFLGKYYLLVVDAHSKWPEIFEMKSTTAGKTITILRRLFAQFGLPHQVVSDNGPQFTSDEFQLFMQSNGIKHIRSTPYHPATNGAVERLVRTFKESMKAGLHDHLPVQHRLSNFLLSYRSTPHSTTGESPALMFMGRQLRTRLDLIRPSVEEKVLDRQATQKQYHDQHSRMRELSEGDNVLVKSRSDWLSGVIEKRLGPTTYLVKLSDGRIWRRHIELLKWLPKETTASEEGKQIPDFFFFPSVPEDATESTQSSSPLSTRSPAISFSVPPTSTPLPAPTVSSSSRYPTRIRKEPDRYHDSYMHT